MKNNKTKFNLIEVIIFILITGIVCFITSGIIIYNNIKKNTGIDLSTIKKDKNLKKLITSYNILDLYYKNLNKNKLTDKAIKSMLNGVNEKNTYYLSKEKTNALNNALNDKQIGIGVVLNISNEDIIINEVYKDSPASKAGLIAGDKVVGINNSNINNNYNVLTELFNSKKQIKIKVLRNNQYMDFLIKPNNFKKKNITYKKYNINDRIVLFVRIKLFSKNTYNDFKNILEKNEFSNINGLIIDLRDNNGGYLSNARKIAELFLEKNKNLYILKNKNITKVIKDKTKSKKNYDIVVLVNKNTASASEVLTIALKESYGATVIGQKTYGKNSVQKTKILDNGSMIKYTTFKWYSPKNHSVKNGINPDINISKGKEDNQLQAALNFFK